MNILLVNPRIPETYWSFHHALKFIRKKAANPPLGLLTVAALLPGDWHKKMIDLNIDSLTDATIQWADFLFVTAMSVQKESVMEVIETAHRFDTPVVAGGPLFTGDPDSFNHVDHLVLNEAELTLPRFLYDLDRGIPGRLYRTDQFADLHQTPPPDYSLLNVNQYAQLSLQYSRGCPFQCEFCEITALLGRKVRTKTPGQILSELDGIYRTGYRGSLFFVDDNFIGNRHVLKRDLLPRIIGWNRLHRYPFTFTTEASINLADDPELMELMVEAGFERVFIGIETVHEESLAECDKNHNMKRNMIDSVQLIQAEGMEVTGGFIVGFDHDPPNIFQQQIDFIRQSGIITAMVGLLNAPNRTRLYQRLQKEGRILNRFDGNNTNLNMNFIPKMDKEVLLRGYHSILNGIYSSKAYYDRLIRYLRDFRPSEYSFRKIDAGRIMALLRSLVYIGIFDRSRYYYWKLFFWSLIHRPRLFPMAITYSIYGYHFQKIYGIR
ncbi:MAG: B12-binding domain-containing radical SAM protein [Bacteroidales bacterium]